LLWPPSQIWSISLTPSIQMSIQIISKLSSFRMQAGRFFADSSILQPSDMVKVTCTEQK
jgi:hypothetical protein